MELLFCDSSSGVVGSSGISGSFSVARLPCILRAIVFASFTTCMVTLLEASALMIRVTSLLRGAKVISRALTALLYGGQYGVDGGECCFCACKQGV